MKKTCNVCGFKNPSAAQNCVTCNAPLPPGVGLPTDALCCPTPDCVELAVPPPAKYCPLCGAALKPVSCDLWEEKFVEPALEKDFVAALQGSPELLREAVEMGLPPDEAEGHLGQAFIRRAGVPHGVLQQWVREHVVPLEETRDNNGVARSEVLSLADDLNIKRPHAELILHTLASETYAPAHPVAETLTSLPAETTPADEPPPDQDDSAHYHDAEIFKRAESGAAITIVPQRFRPVVPENKYSTAPGEPQGDGAGPMAASFTKEETKEEVLTPSGATKSLTFRVAVVCCVIALGVSLALVGWLVFRRAPTNPVDDRPRGDVASNVSSAANVQPVELPTADTTPDPAVVASPEATPDGDASNSNSELPVEQAAVLILLTNADGVTVWINGRQLGVISKGRPGSFKLPPGAQSLSATTRGHEPYQKPINLKAGEKRTHFILMHELGTPTRASRARARQYLQAAQAMVQRRSYEAALEQVNEGLRLDPNNQELLRLKQRIESARATLTRPSSTPVPQQPTRRPEYDEPPVVQQPRPQRQPDVVPIHYEAPRMTRKYEPAYPQTARNMRVSGVVHVDVSLDERGRIIEARAVGGPMLLQQAAVDAAKRSGYSPARRNGQFVSSSLRINFVFKFN